MRRIWHGPMTCSPWACPAPPDLLPQPHGVLGRLVDVDLVADLAGVPGAGDGHVDPVDLEVMQVVVADVGDGVAEQVPHDGIGLRPLHLHGAHIDLLDAHVHPGMGGDAAGPQQDVAVGEGEPEAVLLEAQQDRIVEDPSVLVREEDVFALADRALREVAGDQQVGEVEGVGAGDLDLPFDADVPEGDALQQRPVLGDRVAVVPGVVRVVVDAVHRDPVTPRGVEERGFADAGIEQNSGVLVDAHGGLQRRSVPYCGIVVRIAQWPA